MKAFILTCLISLSSSIVAAQAIDTTVCLVVSNEKDVAYATGGKPLTICDPQRIYQMITGEKIRTSTMRYTQKGNLIYESTPDG